MIETLDHIAATTSDSKVRATALGLSRCLDFKFLVPPVVFSDLFHRFDVVRNVIQSVHIDVLEAAELIDTWIRFVKEKRSPESWRSYLDEAIHLANVVNIEAELPQMRRRRISVRIDENASHEEHMTSEELLKANFFFKTLDQMVTSLEERFPRDVLEIFSALLSRVIVDPPSAAKERFFRISIAVGDHWDSTQ